MKKLTLVFVKANSPLLAVHQQLDFISAEKLGRLQRNLISFYSFILVLAFLQIGIAQPSIVTFPSISVLQGSLNPMDLTSGKYLLYFFLPSGCPACEEFEPFLAKLSLKDTELIYITNSEGNISNLQAANLWRDSANELASLLNVQFVPSLYLISDGKLTYRGHWPFSENLPRLRTRITTFDNANPVSLSGISLFRRFLNTSLPEITFQNSENALVSTSDLLSTENNILLIACSASCGVCQQEFQAMKNMEVALERVVDRIWIVLDEPSLESNFVSKELAITEVIYDTTGKFFNSMEIYATPTHLLVDEKGVIQWYKRGYSPNLSEFIVNESVDR